VKAVLLTALTRRVLQFALEVEIAEPSVTTVMIWLLVGR
jgi:hypothetical protein